MTEYALMLFFIATMTVLSYLLFQASDIDTRPLTQMSRSHEQ